MHLRLIRGTNAAMALLAMAAGSFVLVATTGWPALDDEPRAEREAMVKSQIEARGIKDRAVLEAIRKVPRHRFVPEALRGRAYDDGPLPIGEGQTISQPYIVALMTELIAPRQGHARAGDRHRVGLSGRRAGRMRRARWIRSRSCRSWAIGPSGCSASWGIAISGPGSATAITAGPTRAVRRDHPDGRPTRRRPRPAARPAQGRRATGRAGRPRDQKLVRITRTETGFRRETLAPVRFVPMTGKAQDERYDPRSPNPRPPVVRSPTRRGDRSIARFLIS